MARRKKLTPREQREKIAELRKAVRQEREDEEKLRTQRLIVLGAYLLKRAKDGDLHARALIEQTLASPLRKSDRKPFEDWSVPWAAQGEESKSDSAGADGDAADGAQSKSAAAGTDGDAADGAQSKSDSAGADGGASAENGRAGAGARVAPRAQGTGSGSASAVPRARTPPPAGGRPALAIVPEVRPGAMVAWRLRPWKPLAPFAPPVRFRPRSLG